MKLSLLIFVVLVCTAVKCSSFSKTNLPRSAMLLPQLVALHDPDFLWKDIDPIIFWNGTEKPQMQDPEAISNIVAKIITEENNRYTNEDKIIPRKEKKEKSQSDPITRLIAEIILNNGYKVYQKDNNGGAKDKTIFDWNETTKLVSPIKDLSPEASTLKTNVEGVNGKSAAFHHHIVPQFVFRYRPENVGLHAKKQTPDVPNTLIAPSDIVYPPISKSQFKPEIKAMHQLQADSEKPNRLLPKHKSFYELNYSMNKILDDDKNRKSELSKD